MNEEIWKDVVGYEGVYLVSNMGNVKRVGSIANMKFWMYKGYLRVTLTMRCVAKKYFAHRLVAIAFIANPCNKRDVNHINAVKTDNSVENLEWVTAKENHLHAVKMGLINHHYHMGENAKHSKLTAKDVICIRIMKDSGDTYKGIAEKFGVALSTIQCAVTYRSWKHISPTPLNLEELAKAGGV